MNVVAKEVKYGFDPEFLKETDLHEMLKFYWQELKTSPSASVKA